MHVPVIDGTAFRCYFDHALLLPLRARHVFAVTEKLQITEAGKNRAHPHHRHSRNDEQSVGGYAFAVTLSINRPTVIRRDVAMVLSHGIDRFAVMLFRCQVGQLSCGNFLLQRKSPG